MIAFGQAAIKTVRRLEPKIQCAWLHGKEVPGSLNDQVAWLVKQAESCNVKTLDLNYKLLTPELVAALKDRGYNVWTWTVDRPGAMRELRHRGVDSITTNRPDVLQGQLQNASR